MTPAIRRLQAFETGSEDFMTGGWVRVLARAGLVTLHGTHRGVLLVEFLDGPWD